MTDFFWRLSLTMILSLQSPIFSLHGEESGVKWGGGQKKRLNVIDKEQASVCHR